MDNDDYCKCDICAPNNETPLSDDAALNLLFKQRPDVKAKLLEMFASGRWFLTITYMAKRSPGDPHNLQHYTVSEDFRDADTIGSLEHLLRDFKSRFAPTEADDDSSGEMH